MAKESLITSPYILSVNLYSHYIPLHPQCELILLYMIYRYIYEKKLVAYREEEDNNKYLFSSFECGDVLEREWRPLLPDPPNHDRSNIYLTLDLCRNWLCTASVRIQRRLTGNLELLNSLWAPYIYMQLYY